MGTSEAIDKLATAEKDTARLDWLEKHGGMSICNKKWFVWRKDMTKSLFRKKLRAAIDDARE